MNAAYARGGRRGGYYELPREAALDLQLARSALDGNEFIFDVQGHFVNPTGAWTEAPAAGRAAAAGLREPIARCAPHRGPGARLPALPRRRRSS